MWERRIKTSEETSPKPFLSRGLKRQNRSSQDQIYLLPAYYLSMLMRKKMNMKNQICMLVIRPVRMCNVDVRDTQVKLEMDGSKLVQFLIATEISETMQKDR